MSTAAARFLDAAGTITRNLRHRGLIQTALRKYETARDRKKSAFHDWESARQAAAETKWDAINHLDTYLSDFAAKLEARGTQVHWCSTGPEARDTIRRIIREAGAKSVVKSKAMTAEATKNLRNLRNMETFLRSKSLINHDRTDFVRPKTGCPVVLWAGDPAVGCGVLWRWFKARGSRLLRHSWWRWQSALWARCGR